MRQQSQNYLALVIKCQRSRERDLSVTLLTREQGKINVQARGVRRLTSTKRAFLETGNLVHAQLVATRGWPLLTQATLVADNHLVRGDLAAMRKFMLFLEILDRLLVSEELPASLFEKIIYLRELFLQHASNRLIRPPFEQLLSSLGFAADASGQSVTAQVEAILDTPLRAYDYLQVKSVIDEPLNYPKT